MLTRSSVASVLFVVICTGCGDASGLRPRISVRDSAGIVIAEHSAQAVAEAARVQLVETPDLEIGVAAGDSLYQLYRLVDATITAGGNVAILMSEEVRTFDSSGSFVRRFSRVGEGPGELGEPTGIAAVGDSLLVMDEGLQRITIFTEGGAVVRTAQLEPAMRNPRLASVFADGTLLILDDHYRRPQRGFEVLETYATRHDAQGRVIDTLPKQPLAEMGQLQSVDVITTKTFGSLTATAGDREGYWVAVGPPEIARYDSAGDLVLLIRWDADLSIPAGAVKEHIEASVAEKRPEWQAAQRAMLTETPVADEYPATLRAFAAPSGELWVERFRPYTYKGPREWLIFDAAGRIQGTSVLPSGFEVYEAGTSYLLGKSTDGDGIERIVRYELR